MNLEAAAIQMNSGPHVDHNLTVAAGLIAAAAQAGARLVVLPENFALMPADNAERMAAAEEDGEGLIQDFLAAQAADHKLWLVGGTIPIRADTERIYAACCLYDPDGKCRARYDKIHLFDVEIAATGERYLESSYIKPGSRVIVADTPFGRLGLAVCYDIRFPELFRLMSDQGVDIIAVPSAFTEATGEAHWEVLLRARAIENLSWVIAPGQTGAGPQGRSTWGHSMIVNPWGVVTAEHGSGPGVTLASLDLAEQVALRRRFPVLTHRKSDLSM